MKSNENLTLPGTDEPFYLNDHELRVWVWDNGGRHRASARIRFPNSGEGVIDAGIYR